MSASYCFLHVSDLRLGEPVAGVHTPTEVIRNALLNAPYKAFELACDVAIREQVEFVLLTGNALDLHHPSPKPLSFLLKQFRRLAKEGIEVYWCSGMLDPAERWPRALELPENVTVFAGARVEVVKIQNQHGPVCTLLASGPMAEVDPSEFRGLDEDLWVVGAVNGLHAIEDMTELPCDYWALGGSRQRRSVERSGRWAVYSGTPQPRAPHHAVTGSVSLVSLDPDRGVHVQEVPCDRIRFTQQTVALTNLQIDGLKERLSEACLELAGEQQDRWLVVDWCLELETASPTTRLSKSQQLQLLNWLRREFSGKQGGIWSNTLQIQQATCELPQQLLDEDSILGDFLRSLPEWEQGERELELSHQLDLPPEWSSSHWRDALLRFDRDELLVRVRQLGLELLSGSPDE